MMNTSPIAEHDCVSLVSGLVEEGIEFPAGTVGTVVSVYQDGHGYALELVPAAGPSVVAILLAHQVRRVL